MKVCIQIDSSFDDFLNKVGQLNNASCGKVCRLIIEHQLTFYLNRKVIPSFYPGVFADFKKLDVSVDEQEQSDALSEYYDPTDHRTLKEILDNSSEEKDHEENDDLLPGIDY